MTDNRHPEALRLAALYDADAWPGGLSLNAWAAASAAELRRLHAENTTLKQGYDAARLEIEALRMRIEELETPTMFWDFNNPEHEAFDSPYYAICDGDFDEGAEVSFMTARALPTKTVRVTRDSEGIYDYEYIDAAKGESNA